MMHSSSSSQHHHQQSTSFVPFIPVLNKVTTDCTTSSLYAGYSDGKVLRYDSRSSTLTDIFSVYDKTDVIDIESMGSMLLTTSHNEVTVFDLAKQKSLSLKVLPCIINIGS